MCRVASPRSWNHRPRPQKCRPTAQLPYSSVPLPTTTADTGHHPGGVLRLGSHLLTWLVVRVDGDARPAGHRCLVMLTRVAGTVHRRASHGHTACGNGSAGSTRLSCWTAAVSWPGRNPSSASSAPAAAGVFIPADRPCGPTPSTVHRRAGNATGEPANHDA